MTLPRASAAETRESRPDSRFGVPPGMRAFSWAGWWLPLPETFRLHDIDGNHRRGRVALADAERMRLEIAWDAVANPNFDTERFARRELVRGFKRSARATAKIERAGSTNSCLLFRVEPVLNSSSVEWDRYVGFCPVTRRAFTVRYRPGASQENGLIARSLCDHLCGQSLDAGQRWAFFSVGFVAPPGFEYERATLNLGDMSVHLIERRRGRQPRVVVRQIHPAKLALSRFDLAGWLEHLLEAESRTYQPGYRKRFPRRDPVIESLQTPLGACVAAESQLRASLRPMLGLRHCRHRRTWVIHDREGDRLVVVQVSHERDQLPRLFERVLQGLQGINPVA